MLMLSLFFVFSQIHCAVRFMDILKFLLINYLCIY
uniref:Uncharacterized protein n=1 Tax=Anguilla anguilla TaxID=7936 RepID=A0A0E9RRF5_ANGAN